VSAALAWAIAIQQAALGTPLALARPVALPEPPAPGGPGGPMGSQWNSPLVVGASHLLVARDVTFLFQGE